MDSTNIAARYSYYPLQETALRITFRPAVALSEWQTTDSSNYFDGIMPRRGLRNMDSKVNIKLAGRYQAQAQNSL